ncbi:amino acid ABC transporter permease [Streptomyces griseoviridis]|uniref:Glutamate transport system permease protein n=1 Tax=Streptomyces griseoviridis TaxID=45398 RepID=A0ABT9LNJ3_STRGD|nr:amino acid ABC transporter permease [Streptomyces griseoviridis]MDP9685082.1 glutamate transport system permease protein [Streptomyces griseoviridis]GGT14879.1 amino acid ABC transporter permease [Streptomyces griseoviridis]
MTSSLREPRTEHLYGEDAYPDRPPRARSGTTAAGRGTRQRLPHRLSAALDHIDGDDLRLFDEPGPRARRRAAVLTAASLVLFTALLAWVLRQFAAHGQLDPAKWRLFGQWPVLRYLLDSLAATVQVTLVSGAIALPLGILLALARLSGTGWLSRPAATYVEVLRAVPLLLLVYAFLLGLPAAGLRLPLFWQLVWPIALTNAAVFAEIFRAAVRALPAGQREAALALGFGHAQTLRLVLLPQAAQQSAPALVSQSVRLLKDSTLGYVVSFLELLNAAKVLGEFNHTVIQSYLVVALVFVVVNGALAHGAARLERRPAGRRTTARAARPPG